MSEKIVWCRWSGRGSIKCIPRIREERGVVCGSCSWNPDLSQDLRKFLKAQEALRRALNE